MEDSDKSNSKFRKPQPPPDELVKARFEAWVRAMELSHAFLMAGLRRKVGPDGDLNAAFRQWYDEYQDRKWSD